MHKLSESEWCFNCWCKCASFGHTLQAIPHAGPVPMTTTAPNQEQPQASPRWAQNWKEGEQGPGGSFRSGPARPSRCSQTLAQLVSRTASECQSSICQKRLRLKLSWGSRSADARQLERHVEPYCCMSCRGCNLDAGSKCSAFVRHRVLRGPPGDKFCASGGGHGNNIRRGELPGVPIPAGVWCALSSPVHPTHKNGVGSRAPWNADK